MNTEAFAEEAQKKKQDPAGIWTQDSSSSHNQGWWWKFRGLVLFTVGTHESLWSSVTVAAQWCSLKHNGIWGWSIYGLNGWDIYDSNGWGSYGKVMYCFFWKICSINSWSSGEYPFRSSHDPGFSPFELPTPGPITWKGRTTPHLRLALSDSPALGW